MLDLSRLGRRLSRRLGVPDVVLVLAAGRFLSSASTFLMLFLTLYLTGPRGLSAPQAGLLAGAGGVALLAGNLTGGRWGDRWGHRKVLLSTSTVAGLTIAAVPWTPVAGLAVTLPLSAYLTACAGVSTGALTAIAVPRGDRRTAVAVGRTASNAGFVLGPPLGAALAAVDYDLLFVVDGVMTLVVRFLVARRLPAEPRGAPVRPGDGAGPGLWRSLRADRTVLAVLPAVVAVDVVYRQLYTTVPLRLRDAGEPVLLYTLLVATGSALILALELVVARGLRHRPAPPVIALGYLLTGLGFALFGLPVAAGTAVLAVVVLTAGEILYKTTATAFVLDAAPSHLVGQYQGLYTGAATSGTMLAGPIGTTLYVGAPGLLWPLCGAVGVVAGTVVLLAGRRRPTTDEFEAAGSSTP